ncbi:hypothetical protein [Dokdonella immobilis]|uniref:Uncharacterized protein n=1 Tax=Dokdonella immobilis TaxID=578942 RepID=A0A1I4WNL5_9GAMM|nr:hypothetical protein [Dokdonella immobilis]SFN15027.1 hypothetical protein SAMN05216289_105183 [Dokdonella immobilis]
MRVSSTVLLLAVLGVAGCASAPKHEVIPVPNPLAETRFEIDEAPDGCEPRSTAPCSLDNRCPVRPRQPLKCYGPIVTQFFCCWKQPY